MIGLAWLRLTEFGFHWGGLSVRDDVRERGNPAAVPAIVGAFIAVACCYAGGNIGEGPGWSVVVFSAALATAGLAIVWFVVTETTTVIDVITIDRDLAAGIRFGGLLAASGLILGRAVAGNWRAVDATIADFLVVAVRLIPMIAVAIVIERAVRPTPSRPRPSVLLSGVTPAAMYLGVAGVVVSWLG